MVEWGGEHIFFKEGYHTAGPCNKNMTLGSTSDGRTAFSSPVSQLEKGYCLSLDKEESRHISLLIASFSFFFTIALEIQHNYLPKIKLDCSAFN